MPSIPGAAEPVRDALALVFTKPSNRSRAAIGESDDIANFPLTTVMAIDYINGRAWF